MKLPHLIRDAFFLNGESHCLLQVDSSFSLHGKTTVDVATIISNETGIKLSHIGGALA
jgi:hypothetical protein